jgi:hypothetical protein
MNLLKVLVIFGSLLTVAHSQTLDCKSESLEQHAQLICDYSILNNNYGKILKDQNHLLETSKISSEEISTWYSELRECQSVKCIDDVFEKWNQLSVRVGKQNVQQITQQIKTASPSETEKKQKFEDIKIKESSEYFYLYLGLFGYLIQRDYRKKDKRTANGYKNNAPSPSIWRRLMGWSIVCFSLYHLFSYL